MKAVPKVAVPVVMACLLAFSGCQKKECPLPDDAPVIAFEDFIQLPDGSARLVIAFEDCQGDVGGQEQEGEENLLLTYYEWRNDQWKWVDVHPPFEYTIPEVNIDRPKPPVKGVIETELPFYYNAMDTTLEKVRFDVRLIDKAGNVSNTVTTPAVTIPG